MSKQITANIPARKLGKMTFPARVDVFEQDDAGQWTSPDAGKLTQAEVIDVCQRATNWTQIKSEHFPMHGFSS
jgi:hypothetical protein